MPFVLGTYRHLASYLFALLFLIYLYLRSRSTRTSAQRTALVPATRSLKTRTTCFPIAPPNREPPAFPGTVLQVPSQSPSLTYAFFDVPAGGTIVLDGSYGTIYLLQTVLNKSVRITSLDQNTPAIISNDPSAGGANIASINMTFTTGDFSTNAVQVDNVIIRNTYNASYSANARCVTLSGPVDAYFDKVSFLTQQRALSAATGVRVQVTNSYFDVYYRSNLSSGNSRLWNLFTDAGGTIIFDNNTIFGNIFSFTQTSPYHTFFRLQHSAPTPTYDVVMRNNKSVAKTFLANFFVSGFFSDNDPAYRYYIYDNTINCYYFSYITNSSLFRRLEFVAVKGNVVTYVPSVTNTWPLVEFFYNSGYTDPATLPKFYVGENTYSASTAWTAERIAYFVPAVENYPVYFAGIFQTGSVVAQTLYPSFTSIDCAEANPRQIRSSGSVSAANNVPIYFTGGEQADDKDGRCAYFIRD